MTHAHFTPSLHPRWPAGHSSGQGGKFMPKHMQGTALWAQQASVALAKASGNAPSAAPATAPAPAKPKKNLATRLLGPVPSWQTTTSPGISYHSWNTQQMKNGQYRTVRQWFVNDDQGNQHGPFGTQTSADNYYAKLTGAASAATVKPPTPTPAGVNLYTTKAPKTAASGVTRNVTQYWFDFGGQSFGPFVSKIARDKQIVIATRPPHNVAKGTDLIGQPPHQRPNRLSAQVAGMRHSQATRSGYQSGSFKGSGAYRSPDAADADLRSLADLQGFSGKPEVITKGEINKLQSSGSHYVLYRGVQGTSSANWRHKATGGTAKSAKQIQDQMRTGDAYFGVGVYGNGYYFATDRSTAVSYSDRSPGSVIRVALPKNAKIGNYSSLSNEVQTLVSHAKATAETKAVFADVGRYAAARGYDALKVPTGYVILNRSILKIQDV